MTDDGYSKAAELQDKRTTNLEDNYFQGNFNFGVTTNAADKGATPAEFDGEAKKFADAIKDEDKGNVATCDVNEGSNPADTIYAQAFIRFLTNSTDKKLHYN